LALNIPVTFLFTCSLLFFSSLFTFMGGWFDFFFLSYLHEIDILNANETMETHINPTSPVRPYKIFKFQGCVLQLGTY
jgi:hypothetical protein